MRAQLTRVLLVLVCLTVGLAGLSSSAAASDKKSKKHHKHHKHHTAATPAKAVKTGGAGAPAAAPADDKDDEGDESAESDEKTDDTKAKPKSKAQTSGDKAESSENSDDKKGGGDEDGDSTVVRRKRPGAAPDGDAPIALELSVGPRALHRTFDFNDPLSNHVAGVQQPYAYKLNLAPAPFVDVAFYPAAFATRGLAASFGIVASYEKLVGTKTTDAHGASFDTLGQQFEVGLRGRLPVGEHEVGLTASYGKHTFHATQTDPGPTTGAVPNVDYTFAGIGADVRLRLSPIEIGAHVGTRLVFDTGALGQLWFSTTKTSSIDAGVSLAYKLTPLFSVVGGVDFLRYAFNFNPITSMSTVVAGGAVDQYISGFLALRVTLPGS